MVHDGVTLEGMALTPKQRAGEKALDYIDAGMTLGLGTGSTVAWTLKALGRAVAEGLRVRGVPTSRQTEELARQLGIPLVTLDEVAQLDLAVDGADEVDRDLNLIKGGGGALLREKIVASAAKRLIVVVDDSKVVELLGTFPLPVEVVPFGTPYVTRQLAGWARQVRLRQANGRPFTTDNGNHMLDCAFDAIDDAAALEQRLNAVPGVVETGLFVGMTDTVLVGSGDGVQVLHGPRRGSSRGRGR